MLLHFSIPFLLLSLDGTPTLNQWVLVEEGNASPNIITIECCGLLVGKNEDDP